MSFKTYIIITILFCFASLFCQESNAQNSTILPGNSGQIKLEEVNPIAIPEFLVPNGSGIIDIKPDGNLGPSHNITFTSGAYAAGTYEAKVKKNSNMSITLTIDNLPNGFHIQDFPLIINNQYYSGNFSHNFYTNSNHLRIDLGILLKATEDYSPEEQKLIYTLTLDYT